MENGEENGEENDMNEEELYLMAQKELRVVDETSLLDDEVLMISSVFFFASHLRA